MINTEITLQRLELFSLDLPQKSVFKSSIGLRKSKETLIVKWTDAEGRIGYGECSCRPDPYYSAEFLAAAKLLIQNFIAPNLKSTQTYGDVLAIMKKIRGWNFTKSAVESAMFQILKQVNPSFQLSQQLKSPKIEDVPVGISLGIYNDFAEMKDVVQQAIDEGYKRVKFKISPFVDTKLFDQINPMLFDNNVYVSFDANGSYGFSDLEKMEYFVKTYDAYIEQPTAPSRFDVFMEAKKMFPTFKVCFDEEVKNMGDLVKLHSLNVLDELNLKIGRVGGITSSIEMLNYCYENDIQCWIGGMFETGIGRLQNLELAAYLPNATAHDLSPSSRYFKEDIIAPEIEMKNGFINVEKAILNEVIQEKIDKYSTENICVFG
ncbi:MAG: O-succinylbenzoate synthase [Cognaticolwellia sp.]|jgi:O-succinylbenzoate synthase